MNDEQMTVLDSLIFADWPRGLYLAKQLALAGQKIAYVESLPRLKNPFALFLNENEKDQREFLESLGFLSQQEGGFCLLSPEGVWSLQNMKAISKKHPPIQNFTCSFKKDLNPPFRDNWLSCLSLNLSAKIFRDNNSIFKNRGIHLLEDCFLFEPSPKKIEEFKNNYPNILFLTASKQNISFKGQQAVLSFKDKNLTAKNFICLTSIDRISKEFNSTSEAHWQWQAYYLTVDFANYRDIIPSYFVFLKNIYLPWCYDNLLSVFHHQGVLEVWMRLKPKENSLPFIKQAQNHLKDFFKNCNLKSTNRPPAQGFKVYGEERFHFNFPKNGVYIENSEDFFHGDLASEMRNEQELFKKLTSSSR